MKKIINIFAIIFLIIIIILNLIFTTYLNAKECTSISVNSFIYIVCNILLALALFFVSKYLDNLQEQLKKRIITIGVIVFVLFNIIWVLIVNPNVVGDSVHVCNLAQTFYRGDSQELLSNLTYLGIPLAQYAENYHQQISLAFVFSMFFRLIHFDAMESLRALNVLGNFLIIYALYKICMQVTKKYEINKILFFILILTFVSLPILSTFIYGDIPSIALCLLAVYLMMKYTESKNIKYAIFASILTMIAYMMRMNSLIFIIATVIYLLLNIIKEFKQNNFKKNILNFSIIIFYLIVSTIPAQLVDNYYLDKYNLNKNNSSPTVRYILMAMEESPRGNGWYNEEIAEKAINNPDIKEEYNEKVKERLQCFANNIGYTFRFYTMKIASMWTENTYSAIRNNTVDDSAFLDNSIWILTFYQKALLILTSVCCLINLIQNRKNLSLEIIFLLLIFIGGFTFHILWEAKSRYIIPYILVLIPIAAIKIEHLPKFKFLCKFSLKGNKK